METGSALLVGTAHAMAETFGSTAHGAGRTMSRAQAKRQVRGGTLMRQMGGGGGVGPGAPQAGRGRGGGLRLQGPRRGGGHGAPARHLAQGGDAPADRERQGV